MVKASRVLMLSFSPRWEIAAKVVLLDTSFLVVGMCMVVVVLGSRMYMHMHISQ